MTGKHRNTGDSSRRQTAWAIIILVTAWAISMTSCGKPGSTGSAETDQNEANQSALLVVHGPAIDRIIIEARPDQAQAIADVVAGEADLLLNPLSPAALRNLEAADLEKLQLHTIPAGSWSILINPIPNAAPYTWTSPSGETSFNPLAIREVRYALNWLFDRQQLVDTILGGQGMAGFTPLPPGLASTAGFDGVPTGLGMSAAGDMNRAIEEITTAMEEAAGLPENSGRLLKAADGFWQYDGKPVSIKFLIRADEPAGRLPVGRYLASRLEQAGLRVQRLEQGRSALASAYFSNPADLAYHIYTEAWAPRTGDPSWDLLIGQQYAPHSGNLPGGADPAWWQYRNPQLDELAQKITADQYPGDENRLADSLKALDLGLREAVRIHLAFQHDTFIVNKARFESLLVPDPLSGLNGRSLRTARIAGTGSGPGSEDRILRVLHLQPAGKTDLGSWDPANPDGFAEGLPKVIAELISDTELDPETTLVPDARATHRWHNGIELGKDDIKYASMKGIGHTASKDSGQPAVWSNHIILPWDLYEVLSQLGAESTNTSSSPSPESGVQPGFDLVSPALVDDILEIYQGLLEQKWVPPVLEGLVDPELAASRYRASMEFMEKYGHALVSNGPFILSSLDRTTGAASLEAYQDYPYGEAYPFRPAQD